MHVSNENTGVEDAAVRNTVFTGVLVNFQKNVVEVAPRCGQLPVSLYAPHSLCMAKMPSSSMALK
jgi:hypothetical protein